MESHHRPWTANTIERQWAWHAITAFEQHSRSDNVRLGMPSSPLGSTDGRTTSGFACHHRPWTAQMVRRRRVWHAIIALRQHTRSNNVGRGMPSSPLESTHSRLSSRVACHHSPWTVDTVGRRRAWHAIIAFGLADTVGRHRASHAIIAFGLADMVRRPMTVERRRAWHAIIALGQHRRSAVVGRGMPSQPLDNTNSRPPLDVPAHNGRSWPACMVRGLRNITEAQAGRRLRPPMVLVGVLRGCLIACMACPCYAVGRLQKHVGDVDGSSEAKVGGSQGRLVGLVGVVHGRLMACMARPCYAVERLQKHASDVCGAAEAKAGGRQGHLVGFIGVLRGHLTACMARPCYAVGRLQKHARDICGEFEALAGGRHGRPMGLVGVLPVGRLQKHARDICGAFEAVAGGRHRRPVGLVGVLRGCLTACIAYPCYIVGRQQKHASDVCGATKAKAGGCQGHPMVLVGMLRGRLTSIFESEARHCPSFWTQD
uniref:Uncharacterized protein n=1 Tax=Solanum lycopersicum TaxID=4081 RepID=A0A3Q7GR05_SOLLC